MPGSPLTDGRRAAAIPLPPTGPVPHGVVATAVPARPTNTRWDHEPTTPDLGDRPPPPGLRPGVEQRTATGRTPSAIGTTPPRGTASCVAGRAPRSARGRRIQVETARPEAAQDVPPFPSSFPGDGAAPPRPDAHHPS
ncbi:hypothetical protein [Umezawaea tangerina]|uniref:hypothetical protein n=1 Tax=Umezawaea tangerina TaxID=84725 RepID=UPI000D05ABBE|nr:hypothetical protein [Umezawaea tangerina]